MSAKNVLHDLYQRWRSLTNQETDAIRSAAWGQVHLCQVTKQKLREEIVLATEELNSELLFGGLNRSEVEREFRAVVEELIVLETRNGEFIAEQMRLNKEEQNNLDRTTRNLRQVHRAYAGSGSNAWFSYS